MARVISELGIRLFSTVLAAGDPNPTPVIDPDRVTPGNWGLIAFIFLLVVAALLYFSLRKQLRKIDFPEDPPDAPPTPPGSRDMEDSPRVSD